MKESGIEKFERTFYCDDCDVGCTLIMKNADKFMDLPCTCQNSQYDVTWNEIIPNKGDTL